LPDQILKLEMGKKFKVALNIPLSDVSRVSISPDVGNQVLIIHLNKNNSNDLILSLNCPNEDLSGEVLGVLASQLAKKFNKKLDVFVSNQLQAKSGNFKTINIQSSGPGANFTKTKEGTIIYSD